MKPSPGINYIQNMKEIVIRSLLIVLVMFSSISRLSATHNRAGEITYRQISELTYEITITTFTYVLSQADRPQLEVEWGDNSTSVAVRDVGQIVFLPNYYKKNVYVIRHTYPGPGIYKIVVQDPNRNAGILNIPNSVNVVFSISTILMVNPALGPNNTPVLLNPPYDKAALGYKFIHNPAAFDVDGDSLSYNLTVCTREDGKPIENYTLPPASDTIYVDPITGDLVWDAPIQTGKYNIAIEINEWRAGIRIGIVVRDMQIEVYDTDNNPPVNGPLNNYCIEAGDSIEFDLIATDADNDIVTLIATSGLMTLTACSARFDSISAQPGASLWHFKWVSCFEVVRDQKYDVLFKAEDNNSELELVDLDIMNITVVGPPPVLNSANPEGKFIRLGWEQYPSDVILGYNIYRREGATSFVPDTCSGGLPESLGFERIAYASGPSTVSFIDTGDGNGLENGKEYTYRILTVFPSGAESKASNELTSALISGIPYITNVSVLKTDPANGKIFLSWITPDTITSPGPFEYQVYRSSGFVGDNYQLIKSIQTSVTIDSSLVDSLINTDDLGFIYKIELYNDEIANRYLIGDPGVASSTYINLAPGDRKVRFSISKNVPWVNTSYDLFRFNDVTMEFDSVGRSNLLEFADTGLVNGEEYCYYVRANGGYLNPSLPSDLVNLSQEACMIPFDNEPPCVPLLTLSTDCDSLFNLLKWSITDQDCLNDIDGYKIFYKGNFEESLVLLETINDKYTFDFKHYPGEVVAGCYAIRAFDANGNESELTPTICVDSCNFYEIPNVFTPNSDGKNDILIAKTSGLVEEVDFKLFNRSGHLMFETRDPRLNWNGTYKGKLVSPGVYFYQCDVYEQRITGIELFHLSGFVHVITEKNAQPVRVEFK